MPMQREGAPKAALLVAAALLLAGAPRAIAQPPAAMPIQGYLTRSDGTPVDGPVTLTISLYDSESSDTPLYQETQTVTVRQGQFTVVLGSAVSLDLSLFGAGTHPLWVGLQVEGEPEMRPRLPMGTVPYAAVCREARRLGGVEANRFVQAASGTARMQWGEVDVAAFTGTACVDVDFPTPYASRPLVFATVMHKDFSRADGPTVFHDPMTVWLEWVDERGFRACVREVDADNSHAPVTVQWTAMGS